MKPILFNTEMVRAILDGRKIVTRRVVKPQPVTLDTVRVFRGDKGQVLVAEYQDGKVEQLRYLYFPGDILYVRETWAMVSDWADVDPDVGQPDEYIYRADWGDKAEHPRWRPSIHMPKEAARLFLRVTGVRVERLQDITEEQAVAEGCTGWIVATKRDWDKNPDYITEFRSVWDSTIKKADLPRYGWDASPWVWVIEFERIVKEEAVK